MIQFKDYMRRSLQSELIENWYEFLDQKEADLVERGHVSEDIEYCERTIHDTKKKLVSPDWDQNFDSIADNIRFLKSRLTA